MAEQLFWLFVLALPVASISWTVTHEEIFREPREWLAERSRDCPRWWQRKFCYVWTCEYCFSHYVAAALVALTGYRLLLADWRGWVIAWLALAALSNVYTSAYSHLRVEIRKDQADAKQVETRSRRAG